MEQDYGHWIWGISTRPKRKKNEIVKMLASCRNFKKEELKKWFLYFNIQCSVSLFLPRLVHQHQHKVFSFVPTLLCVFYYTYTVVHLIWQLQLFKTKDDFSIQRCKVPLAYTTFHSFVTVCCLCMQVGQSDDFISCLGELSLPHFM